MAKKQLNIKGTERKSIPEIEEAAEAYREVRDQRMELTKDESAKQAALVAAIEKHKLTVYKFDSDEGEIIVEISEQKKAKVRKVRDESLDD